MTIYLDSQHGPNRTPDTRAHLQSQASLDQYVATTDDDDDSSELEIEQYVLGLYDDPPEQDQYAALSWNPIMHPRGGAGNPGQFTRKIGVDPDMMSSPEPGGPGMESDEPQAMVAPPLPPARAAVARVDLPDEINNKVQELAAHIPDYLLDGDGRTKDAHITIKMLSDDDPGQIAPLLQDEAPFRAVLGQVTVVDATEARPFDVVAIKVHSPALHRLHAKLSRALEGMRASTNGYAPHLRVADVQPGTADKWIGWDGLEGESVIVDSLTFVNRNHEAHKIPLQGQKGEYQLDRPDKYAAKQLSMFDAPVQSQPRAAAPLPQKTSTPLLDRPASGVSRSEDQPLYEPPVQKPLAQAKSGASPLGTISVPRTRTTEQTAPTEKPKPKSLFGEEELAEARRAPPRPQSTPEPTETEDAGISGHPDSGSVPDKSQSGDGPGELDDGGVDSPSDHGGAWLGASIRTARSEFTSPADVSVVPESLQRHLMYEDPNQIDPNTGKPKVFDYQLQRTAKAFAALRTHGGFVDASGPGTGKSRCQLATAKMFADQGMKAIIVTRKNVISADWDMFTYHGSFHDDARKMEADAPGIVPQLVDGRRVIPEKGQISITTYEKLPSLLSQIDQNTVLLYDESHSGKNETPARSQVMDEAGRQARAVMYSSATPADKPMHIAHMLRAKVFGNRPPEATYRELGLKEYTETNKKTGERTSEWRIDPGIGAIEVHRRLNGLFNRMTKEGLMIKHEIDLSGVDAHFNTVSLPDYANQELANLEDNLTDGMGIQSLKGWKKGQALLTMRRHQETYKIPAITEYVAKELAEDPNRQIVIFADRISESEVRKQGETVHYSQGTMRLLASALEEAGITNIGHLHGDSETPHQHTINAFQRGRIQVMLATLGTGGTGIDLPDLKGDRPRTVVMMTGALAADLNVQALLRTTRLSSKSRSRLAMFFAKTEIDNWASRLLAGKMGTLGAVVKGEVEKLQLPFDIGTEGMQDLIESNRDQIAKAQLDRPYEWRQLTGLPQIKSEEERQQPLFEGMTLGRRSRVGSESSRPLPKGIKRKRFTQDGTPERYTMTAAEIAEAVKSWKEPSKAQIKAENYRKPRIHIHGIEIAIENPRGTSRKAGWKPLSHHYGHLARAVGASAPESHDGEKLDCFIGSKPTSEIIFVVDQERESGRFDEHKILFAFDNMADAKKGYLSNYPSDFRCGRITAMTIDQFKAWLEDGNFQERVADQVSRYAAKYDFNSIHPRHDENKRFVEKHFSHTLAQTLDKPPTPGERKTYDDYVDFLKVGKNKPLPFKDWLKFHRTTKFYQAQKEREDAAKAATGRRDSEGPGEDPEAEGMPAQDMDAREREGSRDPGAVGSGGETEQLIGGKADNRPERTFDPEALAKGTAVESEHTSNPAVAEEIASDHLAENPRYYDKLEQLEKPEADDADSEESETPDQDANEDQEQEGSEDSAEFAPERPSRSTGRPSKHSLNAIRDFAMAVYTGYYQDQDE